MSISELSEQEQIRRNSLAELRKLGIEPYPAAKYEVTATAARIAAEYDHGKRLVFRTAGPHRPDSGVRQTRRHLQRRSRIHAVQQGFQKTARYRRHRRHPGIRLHYEDRRTVGALQRTHGTEQIAAPAAGRQRKGRAGIRRLQRSGTALPPTLCRPDRQSAGTRSIPQTQQDRQHDARVF